MKRIIVFIILLIALIVPLNVNAGIKNITNCEDATVDSEGKQVRVCYVDVEVTDTTKLYKIEGKLTFNNSSLKSIEALDSRLVMTSNNPDNIVFESKTAIKNEKVRLAKITIYIALSGKECNAKWQPTEYGINYSCDIINGNYYDIDGNLTNFSTYDKHCNHYCEKVDDKYYGKDGNIVDEKTYDKECNKHICEIIDNEYYDNNGNIVTEKEYNKLCGKYTCVMVDNEYYNSEGKVVTEKEYNKDCGKYSCVIIDDEYYDETGKLVDKTTWEKLCTIPESPETGSESIIAAAVLGFITLLFIIIATKKNNKIYKI